MAETLKKLGRLLDKLVKSLEGGPQLQPIPIRVSGRGQVR